MQYWTAWSVSLLAPLVVSAAVPQSIQGFFPETRDGWAARGGQVPARFTAEAISIGPHRLEHEGGRLRTPAAKVSGTLRRFGNPAVEQCRIAHEIRYADLYPGIDLLFRFAGNTLKSDYLVAAGADPSVIRFRYAGARSMTLRNGDLVVDGLREAAPVAWQDTASGRRYIAASYKLQEGSVTFHLGTYNRALPLTIDPYVVTASGMQGGTGIDNVTSMAVDADGSLYLAGSTESSDMLSAPVLPRSLNADAFVMKISPTDNRVLWATYLGGTGQEEASAVGAHPLGGVMVAGYTASSSFPVRNAYQGSRPGGSRDGFLVRLDASGALVFGTYFGGTGMDTVNGLAVTATGDIWIAGQTDSSNFPVLGPIAGAARGGTEAFAARFSAAGALQSSTKFGGSAADSARAVAVDTAGEAYLTGSTESTDFPTLNPFQAANGGAPDAFVSKISADGSSFRYSSYLGGPPRDTGMPEWGTAIAVTPSGSAWVAGIAGSLTFPVVAPLQGYYGGGNTDAFLARIGPAGTLDYSTYIGGNGSDEAAGVALFGDGSVALGGSTTSTDLPLVNHIANSSVTSWDGFAVRLAGNGTERLLSTYLSGSESDTITAVAVRSSSLFVAGNSASSNLLPSGAPRGLIDGYFAELKDAGAAGVTFVVPSGRTWTVAGTGCEPGTYSGTRVMSWASGIQCTVTMNPDTGADTRHTFAMWSDGVTANPRVFVAAPGTWTASYTTEYLVQTSAGSGGSVAPATSWFASGVSVQFTATPATGYTFTGWTGVTGGNPVTVAVTTPLAVSASFACAFTLGATSASMPAGGGSVSVSVSTGAACSYSAASNAAWITATVSGSFVRLDVSANSGAVRSGTVTIAGQTFTVTQSATTAVSVGISPPEYRTWTVTGSGCQAGTYTGPVTLSWTAGALCTVNMQPALGANTRDVFTQWSDGSTTNPRTFTAAAGTWGAAYRTEYLVQTTATTGGTASPASAWVASGGQIQLTASPAVGYTFSGWSGGLSGNPVSVTVTAPFTATASFTCAYVLSWTSAVVSAAATALTVGVSTGTGCGITATSNAAWIAVSVTGTEARLTVSANTGAARAGTVTIGGQTFTVQQGAPDSVTVTFSVPPERSFQVTGAGCQAGLYTGSSTLLWAPGSLCTVAMYGYESASARHTFLHWSDGATANPRNFSAVAGSWSAAYRTEYMVGATVTSGGTVSPAPAWVEAGTAVQFTATPAAGYVFAGWTNGMSGNPSTLTVTGPLTVNALFQCVFSLSAASASLAASGGPVVVSVSTGAGCSWSATSNASWIAVSSSGSSSATLSASANTGAARSGTVSIAGQTFTVVQSAGAPVAIGFTLPADRSFSVAGEGCQAGTYTGTATLSWTPGASCTVTAHNFESASARHLFTQWSDSVTANPRTFVVAPGAWTLTYRSEYMVSATAGTGGSVAPAPSWVAAGTAMQFTATPSAGYTFAGWTNGMSGNPSTLTVTGPLTFSATFACAFSLSTTSASVSAAAASVSVSVSTGSGCSWSAASNATWIAVSTGAGAVVLSVAANDGVARTGTATIAGQTVTIQQAAATGVTVSFAPPADRTWQVAGEGCQGGAYTGPRTLAWSAGAQCSVTMQPFTSSNSRATFLQWSDGSTANPRVFTAAASSWGATYRTEYLVQAAAAGGGSVSPSLAWITAGTALQIAATPAFGYVFAGWSNGMTANPVTVTVSAPLSLTAAFACDVTVSTNSVAAPPAASVYRIPVTAACSWTATSSAAWLSASASAGEVSLSVAENTGAPRSATVAVGSKVITVAQSGSCKLTTSKPSIASVAAGGSVTIPFTVSPSGCSWTASSSASWAQVFPLSGTGDGSVSVNVFAHFGVSPRSGTVTIGSTSVPVAQSGASGTVNERFAGLMYYNFLGRLGSKEEIVFHAATLDSGLTRKDVAYNFYNVEEFNRAARFVAGLYVGLLDRDAEFGGWLFQRGAYVTAVVDQSQLVANFLNGAEYAMKFGKPDDAEFVRLLYRYILRREATPEEVAFQVGNLKTMTRVQLAGSFLNSPEFRNGLGPRLTAFLLYSCLLLRDASQAERDAMAAKVSAGTDLRLLIDSLLSTPEFENLLK